MKNVIRIFKTTDGNKIHEEMDTGILTKVAEGGHMIAMVTPEKNHEYNNLISQIDSYDISIEIPKGRYFTEEKVTFPPEMLSKNEKIDILTDRTNLRGVFREPSEDFYRTLEDLGINDYLVIDSENPHGAGERPEFVIDSRNAKENNVILLSGKAKVICGELSAWTEKYSSSEVTVDDYGSVSSYGGERIQMQGDNTYVQIKGTSHCYLTATGNGDLLIEDRCSAEIELKGNVKADLLHDPEDEVIGKYDLGEFHIRAEDNVEISYQSAEHLQHMVLGEDVKQNFEPEKTSFREDLER